MVSLHEGHSISKEDEHLCLSRPKIMKNFIYVQPSFSQYVVLAATISYVWKRGYNVRKHGTTWLKRDQT